MIGQRKRLAEREPSRATRCRSALLVGVLAVIACATNAQPTAQPGKTAAASAALSPYGFDPGLPAPGAGCTAKAKQHNPRRNRDRAEQLFLEGAKSIEQDHLQAAESHFLCAAALDPANARYALSAEIARQYRVSQLVGHAEKAGMQGRAADARAAIEQASRLDPRSPLVIQALSATQATASAALPELHTSDAAPPIELAPQKARHSFHLHTAERTLIPQVLQAFGIQATLDPTVRDQVVPFDATNVDFSEAATLAKLATDTFFVPLDPQHVLVAADTKANRAKYEHQAMETISVPGLSAVELQDFQSLGREILGGRNVILGPDHETITVRAPEPQLIALSNLYDDLLRGRSELQLDIHVFEVDHTKKTDVGMVTPDSATLFNLQSAANGILASNASLVQEIISSGLAGAGDWEAIVAILIASGSLTGTVFNTPFAVFGGGLTETGLEWNSAAANMLLNTSDVRSINQIEMRVLDREEASFLVGERYPVMTQSFSTTTTTTGVSATAAETIPEAQYINLGMALKVKPQIEGTGNVTLNLDLELNSLAGAALNDIPVLSNEQYTSVISVHPGNSALLVSAMSKQDALELTGIPGLSDIPGLNNTTNRQDTTSSTDLVVLVTPHLVRQGHRSAAGPMLLLPLH